MKVCWSCSGCENCWLIYQIKMMKFLQVWDILIEFSIIIKLKFHFGEFLLAWPEFKEFPLNEYYRHTYILLFVDSFFLYILTLAVRRIKSTTLCKLQHILWNLQNSNFLLFSKIRKSKKNYFFNELLTNKRINICEDYANKTKFPWVSYFFIPEHKSETHDDSKIICLVIILNT